MGSEIKHATAMNDASNWAKSAQKLNVTIMKVSKSACYPEDIQFNSVGSSMIELEMPHFSVEVPRSMAADCFWAEFLKHMKVVLENAVENFRKAELAAKTGDSEKVRGAMEEFHLQ